MISDSGLKRIVILRKNNVILRIVLVNATEILLRINYVKDSQNNTAHRKVKSLRHGIVSGHRPVLQYSRAMAIDTHVFAAQAQSPTDLIKQS